MMDRRVIMGSLLIAGTCIGGGMLALPVLTSLGGFLPSLVIFLLCWLFMASTGLLYLEVCLWMKEDTNIISMAGRTLGRYGKGVSWLLYLFLFYNLTLAYVSGCGNLLEQLLDDAIPDWSGPLLFVILFAPYIFLGARAVALVNILFMLGLGISYFSFVILGFGHIELDNLLYRNWSLSLLSLPIAFVSFGYQGTVPTLVRYMEFDPQKTRRAILIGSFIPFIAYIIWEALILGIVPLSGPGGLFEALEQGNNAIDPLKYFIESPAVFIVGRWFAFFALTTSFFGVTLGLRDFLADGLGIQKNGKGKLFLCLLIFIPPLIIAASYPRLFLKALDFAGGFGAALLLGLLPILMAWSGRYHKKIEGPTLLPGGRAALSLLLVFVLFELLFELYRKF